MMTIPMSRPWRVIPLLLLFSVTTPYSSAFSHQLHPLCFIPQLAPSSTTSTALCSTPIRHDDNDDDDSSFPSNKQKYKSLISRRDAISNSGKALASLLLASSTLSPNLATATTTTTSQAPLSKQTIVMTGCNSGIGFDAATRLAAKGHTIHLACRTLDKSQDAAQRIRDQLISGGGGGTVFGDLIPHECNLADLSSVQTFVQSLGGESTIDALCLNAGIARNTSAKDVARTSQGFELTVGTNHLGHFYLANSLLSRVKKGGTIVVTASGVHDPESPGGAQGSLATLGDLRGLEKAAAAVGDGDNFGVFDMVDGGEFDADKAYKDSKLCNVLFTREFQKRLDAGDTGIHVNCFNPGLIVSTGLFRDQNPLFTKVFDFAATDLLKVGETVEWGGKSLEYMTLDENVGSKGGMYYTSPPGSSNKYGDSAFGNQFAISEVSKEARDDGKAKRLWELSEKLVGIAT